jgi:LacI family transcriptional regulator
LVTAREVARRAGVSQPTVSRVVAGHPSVGPEIRERVLAAMRETGYRPNAAARAMRTGSSGNIGVVTARLHNPMYPELLQLLGRELRAAGLRMMVWNADETEGEFALDAARQGMVDGMIFTSANTDSTHLSEALAGRLPVVLINRIVEGWPTDQIASDNRAGGALVADYFLKGGRKRPALLSGPLQPSTIRDREAGFLAAMEAAGMGALPTARVERFTYEEAFDALTRLLAEGVSPDAVFCANDLLGLGGLDALREAGRRVPDDAWVVGYDDIPMAAWRAFSLTTVRQPFDEMVRRAVALLRRRIAGDAAAPEFHCLPAELVLRGSSGRVA